MKPRAFDTFMQGLAVGLLGFLTVAIVFAIANVVAGESPFRTAAILGASLFYGVTDPSQMSPAIAPYVFAYNGFHLLAFALFGVIGAWLARVSDRGYTLWYPALFFFVFVGFHMAGAVQLMAMPLQAALPPVQVWIAGILAAAVMAFSFLRLHPELRNQLVGWKE